MISTTGNNVDLKFRKKVKFMKDNESGKTREYQKEITSSPLMGKLSTAPLNWIISLDDEAEDLNEAKNDEPSMSFNNYGFYTASGNFQIKCGGKPPFPEFVYIPTRT